MIEKAPGNLAHTAISAMIENHHFAMRFQCQKLRFKQS